ncbi:MAG: hypothetical protein LIO67_03555 [Lachnospiraceae bacterium]|nr:hypothetical protein [Lachnospiraceae bacterium]
MEEKLTGSRKFCQLLFLRVNRSLPAFSSDFLQISIAISIKTAYDGRIGGEKWWKVDSQ